MPDLVRHLVTLGVLAVLVLIPARTTHGQSIGPARTVTWSETDPSTSDRVLKMPGLPYPTNIDQQSGTDAANTLSGYPDGSRWLLGTQVGNFIAHDGWVDGRENEHDRTEATKLTENISSEDRTSIAVESMPYDLPGGHELVIQTGDPSNPPLKKGEDRILAYVDEGVSSGATSIPIDDGNGNPVTITASSGDRILSDFQSLWVTQAREQIRAAMQTYMTGFVNAGGDLDGIALDTELSIEASKGIKHDPRWDDSSKGFVDGESMKQALSPYTIDEVLAGNNDAEKKWDKEIQHRVQVEALNEAIFDVIKEDFPNAKASDWNDNNIGDAEAPNAPNTDGVDASQPHIFGTHSNHGLYASVRNLSNDVKGSTAFKHGISSWATLRWQTKFIRTMVRENDGAVQPWLPYRQCCGGGFYVVNTKGQYFREFWFQMVLHTDPEVPALFFQPKSEASDSDDIQIDGFLEDINEAVAGDSWTSVTSTDIAWDAPLIATAVDLPDRRLWRVSVRRVDPFDNRSITVDVSNGDTVTIPGGEVGAWYETGLNESPTFSYTHPSVDNILPSDEWIDFRSSAWNAIGGNASVSGGISDPDGGTDAYRVQDEYHSNELSLQEDEWYTFSVWVKKDGGNVRLRVKSADDLSNPGIANIQAVFGNTWRHTRIAFKAPAANTVLEIDASKHGYYNQYFYQPMLNKGKLEGPYERPAKTVGVSQTLSLQKGGNLVSSAVQPLGPDLEAVLGSAAASIAKIETEDGKVFEPDTGTDEIGTWDSSEAYKIHAETPTSFSIEGIPLDGTEVSLGEGWNWLPYPDSTSVAINQALEPIQDDLVMVKDETGRVYRPAQGTDQIGSLQPGTAYKILLENPVTLSYPLE